MLFCLVSPAKEPPPPLYGPYQTIGCLASKLPIISPLFLSWSCFSLFPSPLSLSSVPEQATEALSGHELFLCLTFMLSTLNVAPFQALVKFHLYFHINLLSFWSAHILLPELFSNCSKINVVFLQGLCQFQGWGSTLYSMCISPPCSAHSKQQFKAFIHG